jgi:hypothetical protein
MWSGIVVLGVLLVFAVLWYTPLGARLGIGPDPKARR